MFGRGGGGIHTLRAMPVESVTLTPEPQTWAARARAGFGDGLTETARRFRMQMGWPVDRPVVMAGHQAAVWHAGILAKWLATAATAAASGGRGVWCVVDQDPEDFTVVRYPAPAGEGAWAPRAWRVGPEQAAARLAAETPPCSLPLFDAAPPPPDAGPAAAPGLGAIHVALAAAKAECRAGDSAARQLGRAAAALARPLAGGAGLQLFCVTDINTTDLFCALVMRMAERPSECVAAYNAAVHANPHAGVAPLAYDPAAGRYELPLWQLDFHTGVRRRVFASQVAGIRNQLLAPRALLLTAILRMAGCDLFVHGLGGGSAPGASGGAAEQGGYEAINDRWIRHWLGEPLAPAVVATATVTLALGDSQGPAVRPRDVREAQWLAHHARHSPGVLGDGAGEARRRELAGAVAVAEGRADRAAAFRALHEYLGAWRCRHAAALEGLASEARSVRARLEAQRVLRDRTWAFPLHSSADLADLRARIARVVGSEG